MAIDAVLEVGNWTFPDPNTSPFTTASFTPADDSLLVVLLFVRDNGDGDITDTMTIDDSESLTWTSRHLQGRAGGDKAQGQIWTAPVTTGASMTITWDNTVAVSYALWGVWAVTEYNTGSPVGATGGDASDSWINGAQTFNLSSAPSSASIILAGTAMIPADAGTFGVGVGSGWTEVAEVGDSGSGIDGQLQTRTGYTGLSVDWADVSSGTQTKFNGAGMAVEVKAVPTVPAAPAAPTGAPGHESVLVSWVAPSDGGATISDYDVDHATAAAPTTWLGPTAVGSGTATSFRISGLTISTGYVFRVRAENSVGNGSWSSSSGTVTPTDNRGYELTMAGDFALTMAGDKTLLMAGAPAGGATLVVDDLASGSTLDNVTLTQAHTVAVADMASASTLDSPTLVQHHVLVVADLSSATTLDAPTLVQHHALTVDDATSSSTLDTPTLTQAHTLGVNDAASATTLDDATLTQAHTLAVSDASSPSSLDNAVLAQTHTITVQDAQSATTLDGVVLGVAGQLAVDDLTSATTLDGVALTQQHALTVQDLTSATTLDAVVLVVSGALVVDDLTSSATLDGIALTQHHVLAVNDLVSAMTLDAPTLGVTIALTVADMTSSSALDAVTVGQVHNLNVADLASTATLSTTILTQLHQLAVQDATSATTLDFVILLGNGPIITGRLTLTSADDDRTLTSADDDRTLEEAL